MNHNGHFYVKSALSNVLVIHESDSEVSDQGNSSVLDLTVRIDLSPALISRPHVRFPRVQVSGLKLYVRLMCSEAHSRPLCRLYRVSEFILNGFLCVRFLLLSVFCFLVYMHKRRIA